MFYFFSLIDIMHPRGGGGSAGDDRYLYLQTQFGEHRCTQFRVIVVTAP